VDNGEEIEMWRRGEKGRKRGRKKTPNNKQLYPSPSLSPLLVLSSVHAAYTPHLLWTDLSPTLSSCFSGGCRISQALARAR
jgi:hypothetical protein